MAITLEDPKAMELPKETLEAFKNNEFEARVWYEKYALKDINGEIVETRPEQMWQRIAHVMASVEKTPELQKEWEEKFYWLLKDWRFLPGGRIAFGAGQTRKSTLNNCYVIPIKEDSIEGIFEWCREAALTYSRGGGVGTDISILRPKGSPVSNSAITSTGSVSFMQLFSTVTGTIGQAARRGALLLSIDVTHPDIENFISIKSSGNLDAVRYANVSVKVTDDFMRAVESDLPVTLHFKNDKVEMNRTANARDIWNRIIKSAWASAEPGVLFFDTARKMGTTEYNGLGIISTNPCVLPDTLILGDNRHISALVTGSHAFGGNGRLNYVSNSMARKYHGPLINIKAKYLDSIKCTPEHPLRIVRKQLLRVRHPTQRMFLPQKERQIIPEWVPAGEIRKGDYVMVPRIKSNNSSAKFTMGISKYIRSHMTQSLSDFPINQDTAWFLGLYVAEGNIDITNHTYDVARLEFSLNANEKEYEARIRKTAESLGYKTSTLKNGEHGIIVRMHCTSLSHALKDWCGAGASNKQIPDFIMSASQEIKIEFLKGLFAGDGWKNNNTQALQTSSKKLALQIQLLVASLGCLMSLYHRGPREIWFSAERRMVHQKESWTVQSSNASIARIFDYTHHGPSQQTAYLVTDDFVLTPILSIGTEQYDGDVWNIKTDDNTYLVNNAIVHNCGEEPLGPYDCCCLGSLNLNEFVKNEFSDASSMDWEALERAASYATRFLDNVLTYNADRHALEDQKRVSLYGRRIGVGITGLGDCLIKLQLKYDTEEAIAAVDTLMEKIKLAVYNTSVSLATEKGAYPAFDADKHVAQKFIKNLPKGLIDRIYKEGLRNSAIMTVPPCGSISAMAGTTSGLEPLFAFHYIRRSHSLSKGEFKVYHSLVGEYMKRFKKSESELPSFFVTAHQIKPQMRVKMQAAIQKHVDAALSSTVNLPEDISVEAVSQIYFQAWKAGLKGCTVYREGSREGILETDQKKKPDATPELSKEFSRPQLMSGKTIKMPSPQGSLYITANSDETGKIIEAFVELGKRNGEDKATAEAIGRLISAYLQQGGDIKNVVKILKGIRGKNVTWDNGIQILSLPDAVGKALDIIANGKKARKMQYTEAPSETEQLNLELCPECGEDSVKRENGCVSCTNCSYSKCG